MREGVEQLDEELEKEVNKLNKFESLLKQLGEESLKFLEALRIFEEKIDYLVESRKVLEKGELREVLGLFNISGLLMGMHTAFEPQPELLEVLKQLGHGEVVEAWEQAKEAVEEISEE